MKQFATLVILVCGTFILEAQNSPQVQGLVQKIRNLEASALYTGLPENYKDYSFEWNSTAGDWDSTNIDIAEFWGTPDEVNIVVQTLERDASGLTPGNWYEIYNMNLADYDELDPLLDYTYVPGDSVLAVVDAPFFGIFPLSSYYTRTPENRRLTEESYYDERLLGDPEGLVYSLGGSVNHYDGEGRLDSYVVVWDGLDSTHFYYDMEGRVDYSVEMIAEFGSVPEEYILTNFEFDSEDRLISKVTTYYLDEFETYDFKDSLVYKYGTGRDYEREEYYYDIDDMVYIQGSVVHYYFPEDTVEIVDIYQVSPSGTYLSERTRTVNDQDGRFLHSVTERSFGTFDPLSNSTRVVRVYDGGTVSSSEELTEDTNELQWRKQASEVSVWWDESYTGELRLFAVNGRQLTSVQVNGTSATLIVPSIPAGIYYLVLAGDSGQIAGTASTYFE